MGPLFPSGEMCVQTFIKQRATETGDVGFRTPAVDVEGFPLLSIELIVYTLLGTTPSITATMQTSNDLESWESVSNTDVSLSATGQDRVAVDLKTDPYGRYVRWLITISGTTTSIEYSLVLNTYASS